MRMKNLEKKEVQLYIVVEKELSERPLLCHPKGSKRFTFVKILSEIQYSMVSMTRIRLRLNYY